MELHHFSQSVLKFRYSEKATKFCEIFILLLTVCIVVKSKVKILQNCVAFSEYMNFNMTSSQAPSDSKLCTTVVSM